ncbi:MAG: efflux RND transporter periplasmic adaptor subunit [Pirellulaceae bacterium]|nr:efflux RND transporter periplasmic adaptor subunit [Pirellulaceae bacterium]
MEELLVVEGQEVRADQPVARLVDADARLNLREAESTLQLREAERDGAQAVLTAAKQNLEQPVHLEAAHAEAEAALATLETEIKNLPFLVQAAEARLTLARQDLEGKKLVAESIAGRSIQKAQSEFDSATAALAELKQRGPSLARQQEAWQRRCDALHTTLKLKTDEHRAVDEGTASLAAAEARLSQARLAVETAQLRLERMTIRSPIAGRVLSLTSQPGQRVMGINAASERDASTVVTLYDPNQLQVRVDVRLEDVPLVQVGQPVQISTAAAKESLAGQVLAMTSQADIQKNTLQVKVSIDQPADIVRPEMLAQVTFLAPERPGEKLDDERDPLRLLVPRELVEPGESNSIVWVADAGRGLAVRRSIQLGRAGTDQLVEVTQGLNALDKLIASGREGLSDGDRIRITGTDPAMGADRMRTPDPSNTSTAARSGLTE